MFLRTSKIVRLKNPYKADWTVDLHWLYRSHWNQSVKSPMHRPVQSLHINAIRKTYLPQLRTTSSGSQVGRVILSSPFTSGGPGSSPARSTSGLGFQSLPNSVGFTQNIISGIFLPPLKLYSFSSSFYTGFFRLASYSA